MSTTTTALQARPGSLVPGREFSRLPAMPWRDPHSVSPRELAELIVSLQEACALHPENPDLRTCLGIAHAMNYDPYRSLDALEEARSLDPQNFFAQFKYAELFYRLRALEKAEAETLHSLQLAVTGGELALARHQLSEIRRLRREGTQRPAWTKSLKVPALGLALVLMVATVVFMVLR